MPWPGLFELRTLRLTDPKAAALPTVPSRVVFSILFSSLFVSFSYCGVCSTRLLSSCLSIYHVIVIEKKFQWRMKVHPLWVGQLLSSQSFCKFTLLDWKAFWVDPAPSPYRSASKWKRGVDRGEGGTFWNSLHNTITSKKIKKNIVETISHHR